MCLFLIFVVFVCCVSLYCICIIFSSGLCSILFDVLYLYHRCVFQIVFCAHLFLCLWIKYCGKTPHTPCKKVEKALIKYTPGEVQRHTQQKVNTQVVRAIIVANSPTFCGRLTHFREELQEEQANQWTPLRPLH